MCLLVESENECVKSPVPETRNSLILRLPDQRDIEAWDQFVSIYEPLVYRLARAKGFQDADAREVVQEVLVAVCRAVDRWEPDAEKGRFRDWLFRIARNLMINIATRRKYKSIASGDSNLSELLEARAEQSCSDSSEFDLEYRREVFRWASEQVREQVMETTWQAFWLTSIESKPLKEVALELKMSVGAVKVARSRVFARLRRIVKEFECDEQ